MAPKKRKTVEKLDTPIVSDADLAKAKDAMTDASQKKRANINMMYYLLVNNKKDAYESMTPQDKAMGPHLARDQDG